MREMRWKSSSSSWTVSKSRNPSKRWSHTTTVARSFISIEEQRTSVFQLSHPASGRYVGIVLLMVGRQPLHLLLHFCFRAMVVWRGVVASTGWLATVAAACPFAAASLEIAHAQVDITEWSSIVSSHVSCMCSETHTPHVRSVRDCWTDGCGCSVLPAEWLRAIIVDVDSYVGFGNMDYITGYCCCLQLRWYHRVENGKSR